MGNHTITGELGAGKTILAVGRVGDHLAKGLKFASNVDIFLEWLMPPMSKATYTRLTDFPELDELKALGLGGTSASEKTFGAVLLDELAMFFNARSWQKDGRDQIIIYLRHIRKFRWHTYFIVQDIESIDKQIRNSLVERVVRAGRTDRLMLPLIGRIGQLLGFSGMRPQKHIGYVYYGKQPRPDAKWQDKWEYFGDTLYNAYNTEQEFEPAFYEEIVLDGQKMQIKRGRWREWRPYGKYKTENYHIDVEIVGMYTVLSAWHLYGRYLTFYQLHERKIRNLIIMMIILLGIPIFASLPETQQTKAITENCSRPDSYIINGNQASILRDHIVELAVIKEGKAYTKNHCYKLEK